MGFRAVAARFLLGAVLPAVVLAAIVLLVLLTGQGRREAPMVLFFAALVAVPGVVLLNCWVLFLDWTSRGRLLAAAMVLPGLLAVGAIAAVHGSGRWQEAGSLVWLPFLMVPMRNPQILFGLWALAVATALVAARYRTIERMKA